MQLEKAIEPLCSLIYEKYLKFSVKYRGKEALNKAVYFALQESILRISSETYIDDYVVEQGGDDYIRHQEEVRGLKIGEAINKNERCFISKIEKSVIGKRIRKDVYVLIVNDTKERENGK